MRDELLNETVFTSLLRVRAVIAVWTADYNITRPHSALDYQTPAVHAAKLKAMGASFSPLPGSKTAPIAQTAPTGVTLLRTLPSAG
jgi:putative transposase